MPHIIDFVRYRNSKDITAVCDGTCDHHNGCDYPADGIFYADDDYDTAAEEDSMWDLEP